MSKQTTTGKYFDPLSVRASIIADNYSEMPVRSIAARVERIKEYFWRIIDNEPRRELFHIPKDCYEYDERREPNEVGLLEKRSGEKKTTLTPLEILEGRTHSDVNKWLFHYGDDLMNRLPADILTDYRGFFSVCRSLNDQAKEMAVQLAVAFDNRKRGSKSYPGSLAKRMQAGKAYTRLLRYEDTKFTRLVLFDHEKHAIHGSESDPRRVLMFPGTKFWAVTRGHFGTGTVHGVFSSESAKFDASLHRDRDCVTVHWISRCDPNGQRFAVVTFVHCELYPEDVEWFDAHIHDLKIDRGTYQP